MIVGWTTEFADRTRRHVEEVLSRALPSSRGELDAAGRTRCLPVYADLSGYILLSSNGDWLFYDPELESVGPLRENVWEKVATVAMAKRYPDLSALLPVRPTLAPTCPACAGSGRLRNESLFCSTCGGYGWIDN
jgi:hypothetical protein